MKRALPFLLLFAIACSPSETPEAKQVVPGNPERGKELIAQQGCNVCHAIPGIGGLQGSLGPTLAGVASRPAISDGVVQNTPANMTQFIQNPQSLNANSAMPAVGLPPGDAQDMTAYLFTLK